MATHVTEVSQYVRGLSNGRPLGILSVVEFGARGDGATNDTSAIQAAINAAAGGGVVYSPPGTYKVGALTWDPEVTLQGAGAYVCVLEANAAVTMLTLSTAPSVTLVAGTIRDLTLRGSHLGKKGISLTDVARFYMDRVVVERFTEKGLEVIGSLVFQVYRSQILDNVIGVDGTSSAQATPNLVAFRDCVIQANATYGLQWQNGALLVLDGCEISDNGTSGSSSTGAVKVGNMCTVGEGIACVISNSWFEGNNGHSAIRINAPATSVAMHICAEHPYSGWESDLRPLC